MNTRRTLFGAAPAFAATLVAAGSTRAQSATGLIQDCRFSVCTDREGHDVQKGREYIGAGRRQSRDAVLRRSSGTDRRKHEDVEVRCRFGARAKTASSRTHRTQMYPSWKESSFDRLSSYSETLCYMATAWSTLSESCKERCRPRQPTSPCSSTSLGCHLHPCHTPVSHGAATDGLSSIDRWPAHAQAHSKACGRTRKRQRRHVQ